jgi:hypothetical protein
MFRQVLFTQWRWARTELLLYVLAGFLVPVAIVNRGTHYQAYDPEVFRRAGSNAGLFFTALAVTCAGSLAWRPYIVDAGSRHVSVLSLPVSWRGVASMRFAAGVVLLGIPTTAVLLGSVAVAIATPLPPVLHAYPVATTIRFFLSALVAYGAAFLLQYSMGPRAVPVAIGLILVIAIVDVVAGQLGMADPIAAFWTIITTAPSPFETFSIGWRLIDV